ncbi:restriction endonuclease [bacterium]|nr:restriction endonuclease [bacterium]
MKNRLFYGDCLDVLQNRIEDESIDLIYIDPPFNSKRNYNVLFESIDMTDTKAQKEAFADTWSNVKYIDQLYHIQDINLDLYKFLATLDSINVSKGAVSYLTTMALRIIYMYRKLKETGSFYLHCDPTMSHYLKLVCDLIFNKKFFRNEVIWAYEIGGRSHKQWGKKHDVILYYTKSQNSKFNWRDVASPRKSGTHMKVKNDSKGRIYQEKVDAKSGKAYRYYIDEGTIPADWWIIQQLNREEKERLHYPTQKPEQLLEKIIKASSNKGDVIADFFCGCGTAIAVAQRLNRHWIGVDISHLAVRLMYNRILEPYRDTPDQYKQIKDEIEINGFPRDIASAHDLAVSTKKGRIKFQDWIIEIMLEGVSNPKKVGDGGYDGYLTLYRDAKVKDVVLIEVKSGKLTVKNIREFIHVVNHEKAAMGVFVCFEDQATKPMRAEAQHAGYYDQESFGTKFPRLQIITVEDLFEGKTLAHPNPAMFNVTFKKAFKQ